MDLPRRLKAVCNYCYQMCWYTLMPLDAKVVDNSQEPRRVALQADKPINYNGHEAIGLTLTSQ